MTNKVKVFALRACKNGLPTKHNLKKKNIIKEGSCDFCGKEDDNLGHALLECPKARDIWLRFYTFFDTLYT